MRYSYVFLAGVIFANTAYASHSKVAPPAPPAVATPAVAPATAPAIVTPSVPETPAFKTLILPPNAEVVVTPNDTLNTKSTKVGDKFKVSTMFDVMQDGFIVIPRGTVGEGTVTYRTGKGAFGKSGKMEVEINSLNLNGKIIPLTGKHRQEGEGNTGATVGAVIAVGVFSAFVTGHSAAILNGEHLRAHTVEPLNFTVPASAAAVPTATVAIAQTATATLPAAAPAATATVVVAK